MILPDSYERMGRNDIRSEIRDAFRSKQLTPTRVDDIVKAYLFWVACPTYIILNNEDGTKIKGFLAPKRGNTIHTMILKRRVQKWINVMMKNGLKEKLVRPKKGHRKQFETNCMLLTLTINQKKVNNDLRYSWENIEKDYNRFMTSMRHHVGNCSIIKVIESQESGFPHIHLLIVSEKPLDCFQHVSKKLKTLGKKSWRLPFKKNVVDKLWTLGFTDCVALGTKKDSIEFTTNYLIKTITSYVLKDLTKASMKKNKQAILTLALGWFFHKKSISVSENKLFPDLINTSVSQEYLDEILAALAKASKEKWIFFRIVGFAPIKKPPNSFEVEVNSNYYRELFPGNRFLLEDSEINEIRKRFRRRVCPLSFDKLIKPFPWVF